MNGIARLGLLALTLLSGDKLPLHVLGKWQVGKPYNLGPRYPVGLDAKQERSIIGLRFQLRESQLRVCGKDVPIRTVDVGRLTNSDFLTKYRVDPNRMGLTAADILDVDINNLHSSNACGDFADPGSHLLIAGDHVVVEIANDYFPLKKQDANQFPQ